MNGVVADTHTIIWYFQSPDKLSSAAMAALDSAVNSGYLIYISAISLVEITYLVEKNKIPEVALERLLQTLTNSNVGLNAVPLDVLVAGALAKIPRQTVPEMGDRIIAATALYLDLPLVTQDERMRTLQIIKTIW